MFLTCFYNFPKTKKSLTLQKDKKQNRMLSFDANCPNQHLE